MRGLAGKPSGGDFAFDAAIAEATGNEDAGHTAQIFVRAFLFEVLGVNQYQVRSAIEGSGGVGERFVDAFIRVLQFDVFADDGDTDALLWDE